MRTAILLSIAAAWLTPAFGQANKGYYRNPALSGSTVIFVAEGDLWQVPLQGGVARRLTSHPALEANPRFSPDGKTLAFNANYEGVN
jgi:tricorn protease